MPLCGLAVCGEAGSRLNPPAHLRWCDGRVKRRSFKLNFPFFMPSCHHWVRAIRRAERSRPSWGPLLLYLPAENIQHRPLLMYPLTDFSTRPTGGPLLLYPLAKKALIPLPPGRKYSTSALIAVPFDRFFASGTLVALPSGRKGPCRSTS